MGPESFGGILQTCAHEAGPERIHPINRSASRGDIMPRKGASQDVAADQLHTVSPERVRQVLEATQRRSDEDRRRKEEGRREERRRREGPQGKCHYCPGTLYLRDVQEPFSMHARVGGPSPTIMSFYFCEKCKLVYCELPPQPETG